jgi:glycosyltransferase involved in cell wall biosynthesis
MSSKLNVLFVADVSIGKVIGGAERVLFEQSTRLAKRGHDIHILTRKLQDHDNLQAEIHGVHEWRYEVSQKNVLSFFASCRQNAKDLFERLDGEFDYDRINFHQPFSAMGVLRSPGSARIPKVYTCHSLSFEEYISRNPKPGLRPERLLYYLNVAARKRIEKRALTLSDRIVVLSRFTLNKLYDVYSIPDQKISIIPGAVDLDKFHPKEDKFASRRKLGIPQNKVILLTIRNLVARMGLENLIIAMKKSVKTAKDLHLVIGGEGSLEADLRNLVRTSGLTDFVTFTGYIPDKDLPAYYGMADLFVLPTRELEGFGLVTLEAMASGVPVLGTPVGGTKEVLGSFNPDFLFNGTTSEAMTNLIVKTYHKMKKEPEWYNEVSKQCRRFVEENYSWERNVDALEALFFQLIAGKRK